MTGNPSPVDGVTGDLVLELADVQYVSLTGQGLASSSHVGLLWVALALVGVLGLASGQEPTDGVARLAAKVKRLAQGDYDVTFADDGDGNFAELSGALDELTDRLLAEKRAHERYRVYTDDLWNALDDVFYVVDEDGVLLRWSEQLSDLTGYAEDEIEEMHALEFFPEAEQDRVADAIATAFDEGDNRIEAPLLTAGDEPTPHEFQATTIETPRGDTILAGVARDITDRRARERQLEERQRALATLMDNIPGMVYRAGNEPDWPFEFVSDGSRMVTGYAPETLESGEINWTRDVILDDNERLWQVVQYAIADREPYQITYRIETADGDQRWVWERGCGVFADDGSLDALEGVVFDITEQKRAERELEQTRRMLSQTQRIASVGGWELDLTTDPYEGIFTDETYRIHELPIGTDVDLEAGLEFYPPEERAKVRDAVERAIADGESYRLEVRFITANDNKRWVRTTGVPVYEGDEIVKLQGAFQDITREKERERALESLQEIARGLLETETGDAVAQLVVEGTTTVFDTSCVAIYLFDDGTSELEPAAHSTGFTDLCGEPAAVPVGESVLWDCFVSGEQRSLDQPGEASSFPPGAESGLVVPMDEYGVFVFATDEQTLDEETRWLVEALVATAEAALDRLETETALRARESELATQNQRLKRQVKVNDIIRSIHQSLIGADSASDIERAVCERLVDAEDVSFAWIGALDADGTTLQPRTWAGSDEDYLDAVPLTVERTGSAVGTSDTGEPAAGPGHGSEPAVRTAHTSETTVVENVVADLGDGEWRREALVRDFHSVISVPLSFDGQPVGVLTVYAGEPGAFSDLEGTVFAELGESIANSIIATNAQQALSADTQVELSLGVACDSFLPQIAREAGCQVEYRGLTRHDDARSSLFITTTGAAAETVLTALTDRVAVTDARLISDREGNCLFEVEMRGDTVPARLIRHGGNPRSIRTVETGLDVVVDVPNTTDVREFVGMLETEYDGVDLRGRRTVERSMQTQQEYREFLFEELTDRQLEVLRTAYYAGFFEWPRDSTGEDIAELLDVTQPTVNRHLRMAQQRLLRRLFDDAVGDGADP